eukprot:m.380403 g.380403  ORF g.380403 m.380403 type:complete len:402 (+) comp56228_c0_seq5:525-1730(+)
MYPYQNIYQQQAYLLHIHQQFQLQYQQHIQQQLVQQQQQAALQMQQQQLHKKQMLEHHHQQQGSMFSPPGWRQQAQSKPSHASESPSSELTGDALLQRIKEQVEYYLSAQNLNHDSFIVGLMDINYFVPLSFIANFNRVKLLTHDLPTIVQAVSNSEVLELDAAGTCIRPKIWQSLKRHWTDKGWTATLGSLPPSAPLPPPTLTPNLGPPADASKPQSVSPTLMAGSGKHYDVNGNYLGTPTYPQSNGSSPFYGMSLTAPYSTHNYFYPQVYQYPSPSASTGTPPRASSTTTASTAPAAPTASGSDSQDDSSVVSVEDLVDTLAQLGLTDPPSSYDLNFLDWIRRHGFHKDMFALRFLSFDKLSAFSDDQWSGLELSAECLQALRTKCAKRTSASSEADAQ